MVVNLSDLGNLLVVYGINVLGALAIALLGWWAAGLVSRLVERGLGRIAHMDPTVATFLASLAYYAALAVAGVLMLQTVGIQATSLVAVLGAASLAVGLALQGTLSNVAAGVMLLLFRPFRLGDTIEVAGKRGTVKALNLFLTEIAGPDNVQVLIPNGQVWGAAMLNFSSYPTKPVSLSHVVPFDRDAEAVVAALRRQLADDPRVLADPAPGVDIVGVSGAGLEVAAHGWAKAADAGAVRAGLVAALRQAVTAPRPASG